MKYNYHKFLIAFVDFQQHFSSNENKKAKLPANRVVDTKLDIFNAQKNNIVYTSAK